MTAHWSGFVVLNVFAKRTRRIPLVPRTIPSRSGPIRVQYRLGKRGAAFLESFEKFRADLELREPELGRDEVEELQSLTV